MKAVIMVESFLAQTAFPASKILYSPRKWTQSRLKHAFERLAHLHGQPSTIGRRGIIALPFAVEFADCAVVADGLEDCFGADVLTPSSKQDRPAFEFQIDVEILVQPVPEVVPKQGRPRIEEAHGRVFAGRIHGC